SRSQIKLASALATSPETARALLAHAAPLVVTDPLVAEKLKALGDTAISRNLEDIATKLPPRNDALYALIAARLKSYDAATADVDRGKLVFEQICVACHRIGIKGNLVGPQLDGIGARGAERLLEDILDPNRAVDPAFRLHLVKMKNGELMSGLLRREQDNTLIFADAAAQEHAVKKEDIESDQTSEFSLMPAGLGEVLTETQLHDLLKFLLDRKS
ncbi:MAG TPA: c-type cytochrome, partial [Verrucomicrobiaceae bacterium]